MEEKKPLAQNGEIILYQPDSSIRLEVLLREDTVWLNRQQIADLFHRDIKTIGKHIQNAKAEELKGIPTVAKFAIVQKEGNRLINRTKEYYNLDMILSVGYRVKSPQGIMFRQWANRVLKDYLLRGHAINQRIERLEQRVSKTEEQIGFFVRTALPPVEGVFYDGQIFDAYAFVADLIREIRAHTEKPVAVYPNLGETYDAVDKDWKGESQPFSACVKSWYEAGARLIGGCCRTTPEDIKGIAALRQELLKPI